ncbi:MAG: tetratricopeptide repeat protein [Candidatus Cloacimonetes bacterium]|nr:tetratricopeptide repeat protein [Candidatus Cloacimonadota bacterium]
MKLMVISIVLLIFSSTLLNANVQKVAVLDFEPQERAVRTVANQMMDARRGDFTVILRDYPQFELIDQNQASRLVSNLGLSSIKNITSTQAGVIGQELGADILIWGTISDLSATEIRVLANVMNVRSSSISQLTFNLRKRSADRQQGLKTELIDKIGELAGGELIRLFNIGEQQLSTNNYTGARDTFMRIVNIDPTNIDAFFYLGYIKFMINDYENSEYYYQRGLELNPEDERILNNLAETQRLSRKYEDAIVTLRRLAEIKPDEMVWFRIGNIYAEMNFIYEAIEAFEEALELNPEFERAHYRLGVLQFDNNYFRESISHLEFISERYPEDDLINRKLTAAYLRTGQLDNAIVNYRNQIERDPQNTTAYLNLAGSYRTLERNQEALQTLNQLLAFEENNPTVYIRLADVKIAMNNLNQAENDANKAISLNPNVYEPYMLLSQIYQIRGYSKYETFLTLEEQARTAYGAEADRLISERDNARNEANQLFNRADQYLDSAGARTSEPSVTRDITTRKQLLGQLITETRPTFFD